MNFLIKVAKLGESSVSERREEGHSSGVERRDESSASGMRDKTSVNERRGEGPVSGRRYDTLRVRSALMRVMMSISILTSWLPQKSSKHLLCNILNSG